MNLLKLRATTFFVLVPWLAISTAPTAALAQGAAISITEEISLPVTAPAEADLIPPRVLHRPVVSGRAGDALVITASVQGDWNLTSLRLVIVKPGAVTSEIPFQRIANGDYQAVITGEIVQPPGLSYWIASTDRKGNVREHFASAARPQPINIFGYSEEQREADRLREWHGKRSTLAVRGLLTRYGRRPETRVAGDRDSITASDAYSDQFWHGEADYSYRPLRTLYAFRFGFGVMRGRRPEVNGTPIDWSGKSNRQPGLNYGFSDITVALLPYLAVGPKLILGASEASFVAGGGGRVIIGYLAGTHFEAAADAVAGTGYRADLRFRWQTLRRFPMALGLELSDWPYSDRPQGVNMSYDLGWRIVEGTTLSARIGRANRSGSTSSGYQAGGGLSQDF